MGGGGRGVVKIKKKKMGGGVLGGSGWGGQGGCEIEVIWGGLGRGEGGVGLGGRVEGG